jgi:3-oxoadipate enol-lactonase
MPFTRAGGLTVHYETTGPVGAPPVVLIHSLGTNLHLWDAQVPALAERYRVVRYDLRGHGLSAQPPQREFTVADLAGDLDALLDALAIPRTSVVGLSIGGTIAQRFAAAYPARVERLVLAATGSRVGTAASWSERIVTVERDGMGALVEGTMTRWFSERTRAEDPVLVDGFRQMLERTPVAGYVGCCAALRDADLHDDDARIEAPTLVIAGTADTSTPPATGAALQAAIPGARLAVIEGAAHIINADRPTEFLTLLEDFLSARAVAGRTA